MQFNFTIEGFLAKDATTRTFDDGNQVTNLRLAHTPRYRNRDGEWADGTTIWIDVACWRDQATETAGLTKGTRILVVTRPDLTARAYNGRGYLQVSAETVIVRRPKTRPTGDQIVTPHGEHCNADDQATATFTNDTADDAEAVEELEPAI